MLSGLIRVMELLARRRGPLKATASESGVETTQDTTRVRLLVSGKQGEKLVGLGGLEPPTSPLSGAFMVLYA